MKKTTIFALLICAGFVATGGFVLAQISTTDPAPSTISHPQGTESAVYESPPAPSIPVHTVLKSMDSEALLDALYGPVKDRLESKASVVQSADFTQNGIRKHVFISNLLSTDSRECLSAHVFAWDNGKWTTETSFTHLEWRLSNWPNCKLRWLQIGHDNFGIEETRVVIDDHGGQTSYLTLYSDVPGDVSSPSSSPPSPSSSHWRPIMEVSQSIEKGETMTIDLSFKESQKPFWTVFVKTIFNHDKPLVVRYESDNHGYSAVGTVPPMTVKKAMKTRGVPVADWE